MGSLTVMKFISYLYRNVGVWDENGLKGGTLLQAVGVILWCRV